MTNKSKRVILHHGTLGMHWGVHKSPDAPQAPKVKFTTDFQARRDARRHMDAKMAYGEGAGTQRKLLAAEIDKKKRDLEGYEEAFNYHLTNSTNSEASARKAVLDRTTKDTVKKGRSFVKQVLGVTGSLTAGVASMMYLANKPAVDHYVLSALKRITRRG